MHQYSTSCPNEDSLWNKEMKAAKLTFSQLKARKSTNINDNNLSRFGYWNIRIRI